MRKAACGQRERASRVDIADRTPYLRASYDAVATTPRPPTPPTTTGLPRRDGLSRCSTEAKKASRSRWSTDATGRMRATYPGAGLWARPVEVGVATADPVGENFLPRAASDLVHSRCTHQSREFRCELPPQPVSPWSIATRQHDADGHGRRAVVVPVLTTPDLGSTVSASAAQAGAATERNLASTRIDLGTLGGQRSGASAIDGSIVVGWSKLRGRRRARVRLRPRGGPTRDDRPRQPRGFQRGHGGVRHLRRG